MIELRQNHLTFSFPEVHESAVLYLDFQRTLRIPDDGMDYPLPPGLGSFPLEHIDDHAARVPGEWLKRGGVMLPMYQSEALWLNFLSPNDYPFAVLIAAGKINALTGKAWRQRLARRPQNYLVAPEQPWLDGYCVEKGFIRQFVAMPLGSGYSAEEQLSGAAEHGGLQICVFPIKAAAFQQTMEDIEVLGLYQLSHASAMGLAPGGRMRQEIYEDPYRLQDWERKTSSRCFIHITNSLVWRAMTGQNPPTTPLTALEYTHAGYPWFEYYDAELAALSGSDTLAGLKSVAEMAQEKGDGALPENASVDPHNIVQLRRGLSEGQVREGSF